MTKEKQSTKGNKEKMCQLFGPSFLGKKALCDAIILLGLFYDYIFIGRL